MNKIYLLLSKFYKLIFLLSFIISSFVLISFLIIALNIKFLIFPEIITNILLFFPNINYLHSYFFPNEFSRTFYNLKRKIKVRYGAKNISYDEHRNVLVTASYFTGYVDILLMDGSDKIIYSKFVDFNLRQPVLCNDILYVPTHYNMYRYDIKYLFEV